MTLLSPCIRAVGPRSAKIAFVGEAPGEDEEITGIPFFGKTGQELTDLLGETGIPRSACWFTNALFTRPPGNKMEHFLVTKKALPAAYSLPALEPGKYLHPDLVPEIERLREELASLSELNLLVALGNTALWALTGAAKISRARGTITPSILLPGKKVLPTYHPAAVLRNWSWRVIVLQDLAKAKREMEFPEIRRISRRITVDPDFFTVKSFVDEALSAPILSCDIETAKGQITCIGFGTGPERAFVIPFWDKRKPNWSYWSEADERVIWDCVAQILRQHPRVLFQNGLYDVQYLWRMAIPVPGFREDTMLLHHAMYPELPKGLEFLGSVYTNELSWKHMRPRHSSGETKREE